MTDVKSYFAGPIDQIYDHPLMRSLIKKRQHSDFQSVEIEVRRPVEVLGYKPAKIYLHFHDRNGETFEHDDWDDELNMALVRAGVKAIDQHNEKLRFALMLRFALRKPQIRFGDGYFNGVVIDYFRKSPFSAYPEVSGLLKDISKGPPNTSASYDDCRWMIERAITDRAHELERDLKYESPQSEEILVGAVALYIDERFSVSTRRRMGF